MRDDALAPRPRSFYANPVLFVYVCAGVLELWLSVYCLLITLTCSSKAELRRAQRNIRVRCEINTNGCQQPLLVQVCCYFFESSRSYGYHTTHAVNTKVGPPKSDLTTHENIRSVLFHNLLLVTLQLFLSHHKQQLSNSCLSKMLSCY